MSRMGKSAKDIFASTASETQVAEAVLDPSPQSGSGPGRPPVHTEDWSKVTVIMLNRQVVFLDRLAADIRQETGAAVRRAEIIRALIDAIEQSGIDLTGAQTEEQLKDMVANRLLS